MTDFQTSESDKINIADVLAGHYHAGTDNIDNFVQLAVSGSDTVLNIDLDGSGSAWQQISTIAGVTGLNVDTLVANGELIVS